MSKFPQYTYFDPKFIQEITDNEEDIVLEIITVFLESNSVSITELSSAIHNDDPAKVHFASHKLIGSFNLIGATFLATLAKKAELTTDKKELHEILDTIKSITAQLEEELHDFMSRLTPGTLS